jgi:hypothetical protein
MIDAIKSTIDMALLKVKLVEKQRLYAQMLKDNVSGPVKEQLSQEIGEINTKLYAHR